MFLRDRKVTTVANRELLTEEEAARVLQAEKVERKLEAEIMVTDDQHIPNVQLTEVNTGDSETEQNELADWDELPDAEESGYQKRMVPVQAVLSSAAAQSNEAVRQVAERAEIISGLVHNVISDAIELAGKEQAEERARELKKAQELQSTSPAGPVQPSSLPVSKLDLNVQPPVAYSTTLCMQVLQKSRNPEVVDEVLAQELKQHHPVQKPASHLAVGAYAGLRQSCSNPSSAIFTAGGPHLFGFSRMLQSCLTTTLPVIQALLEAEPPTNEGQNRTNNQATMDVSEMVRLTYGGW